MSALFWQGNYRSDQHVSNMLSFFTFATFTCSFLCVNRLEVCAYSVCESFVRMKIEIYFNCMFCCVLICQNGRHKSENSNRKSVFIFPLVRSFVRSYGKCFSTARMYEMVSVDDRTKTGPSRISKKKLATLQK